MDRRDDRQSSGPVLGEAAADRKEAWLRGADRRGLGLSNFWALLALCFAVPGTEWFSSFPSGTLRHAPAGAVAGIRRGQQPPVVSSGRAFVRAGPDRRQHGRLYWRICPGDGGFCRRRRRQISAGRIHQCLVCSDLFLYVFSGARPDPWMAPRPDAEGGRPVSGAFKAGRAQGDRRIFYGSVQDHVCRRRNPVCRPFDPAGALQLPSGRVDRDPGFPSHVWDRNGVDPLGRRGADHRRVCQRRRASSFISADPGGASADPAEDRRRQHGTSALNDADPFVFGI